MARNPTDLQNVSGGIDGFTTAAIIGNTTIHNVIAAPGAGLRYRVWKWSATPGQASTARFTFRLCPTGSAAIMDMLGATNYGSVIPGGVPFPVNTGLDIRSQASAAGQAFTGQVLYTIEESA